MRKCSIDTMPNIRKRTAKAIGVALCFVAGVAVLLGLGVGMLHIMKWCVALSKAYPEATGAALSIVVWILDGGVTLVLIASICAAGWTFMRWLLCKGQDNG